MKIFMIAITFLLTFFGLSFAEEEFVVTTYYPSPYGSYYQLTASDRMAIGDVNEDGKVDSNDLPVTNTGDSLPGSLTVQNMIGIGTVTAWTNEYPWARLIINGSILLEDPRAKYKNGIPSGGSPRVIWRSQKGEENKLAFHAAVNPDGDLCFRAIDDDPPISPSILVLKQNNTVVIGEYDNVGYRFYVNGNAYAQQWCTPSDLRMKTNIRNIDGALNKIKNINGVTFDWRVKEFPEKGLSSERQMGIVAQEVEKEFPEVVHIDAKGYRSLDYDKFSAVLLEAVKEQQKRIETLEKEIAALKAK